MANYGSEYVHVFPSTYRSEYINGKLTSENNFINILNSITDIDSYVLDYSNNVLKVVIHGYYFIIENVRNNLPLWLEIAVEKSDTCGLVSTSTQSPTSLDDNGSFTGLEYYSKESDLKDGNNDSYNYYHLQVFDVNGDVLAENVMLLISPNN